MRPLVSLTLAALASFGGGFAIARLVQTGATRPEERQGLSPALAERVAPPQPVTASPAEATERIAAVFALGKKSREFADDHALFLALQKLEARDFLAMADDLVALVKNPSGPFSEATAALCEAWIDRWLEVDGAGALHFLETSPFLDQLSSKRPSSDLTYCSATAEGGIFKTLSRRQREWTEQYLATLKSGPLREVGTYLLLKEAAQQDHAKAKLFLASLSDGGNRPAALQGYVAGLAAGDFRAGFATALAEPAGPLREGLLKTAMSGAAKRGVETVRELLDPIDDAALRRKLVISALQTLPHASRDDLLPWIIQESQRNVITGGLEEGYNEWGNAVASAVYLTNAAPAADWAVTLEGDPEKKMLVTLVNDWWASSHDAPGLRSWLASHAATLEPATAEKLARAVGNWMHGDAAATRAWAEALPPGALREQVRFQIALGTGAKGDLKQAAAVYESIAASDTSGALAKQLGAVLAAQDGSVAAEWALQRPEGPARVAAIQSVAEKWSERDAQGAAEWLKEMPPSIERDMAVREYAAKAVYADPVAAAGWVEQVADAAARGKAAEQVFWVWSWEDPVASRAWLRVLPGVEETWRTDFLQKAK